MMYQLKKIELITNINVYFFNLYRNYPIGVLYDLFTINDKPLDLPWQITVHFDNFPEDTLIRCSCR